MYPVKIYEKLILIKWKNGRTLMEAFEGILNVKDFGAIGDGGYNALGERFSSISDAQKCFPFLTEKIKNLDLLGNQTIDWAGIQEAIFKAFETGSGMVFVPGGEYKISSPGLIIPRFRNDPLIKRPIRIVGAGADISVISGLRDQSVALAEFEAVIGFEEYRENAEGIAINRGLEHFGLENITVARSNKGRVFYYSDHNQDKLRFRNTVFRNVVFRSANYYRRDPCPEGEGLCGPWIIEKEKEEKEPTQANCVEIHHGHQMIFDNVKISGGESGLYLRDCSRVTANMLHIDRDGACHTGIRLENGGTYYFSGLRIEGCPNGSGFSARGVKNILIDGISFESKGEKYMIRLESVVGCNIQNMSLGTIPAVLCPYTKKPDNTPGEGTPAYGLYVGDNTANVVVQGTFGSPLAKLCKPKSRTIFVHRNAKFVRLTDIQIIDADLKDLERDVEVEPGSDGTRDVEVSVILTNNFNPTGKTERRIISA